VKCESRNPVNILIIGAGAVGSFIGARLALGRSRVTLVGRLPLVEAARTTGIRLIEPDGERQTPPLAAHTTLTEAFAASSYDLAILTSKAYDTASVIEELAAAAPVPPPLLSLQNGVGNEESLAAAFGAGRIIAGAIDTPLSLGVQGAVTVHRRRYRAGLAPVAQGAPAAGTAALLSSAGLHVDLFDDHRRLKWSKLLLNLPANAICAILDWTPAEVMAHRTASELEARAWQEAFRVMAAQAIRPVRMAGYPLPLLAPLVPILSTRWLARGLGRTVAGGRGSKMPSLHVALSSGKRSEVTWLNGAVAAAGHRLGIPTPVNSILTQVLSTLTEDPKLWPSWRGQPQRLAAPTE
jgi:2-dehydropantoate 2-reductase